MTKFQPTRGYAKFKGEITRLKEESIKDDYANDRCKKISFSVKTSETNEIPVTLFGYKGDNVLFSPKTKKGEKRDLIEVPWEDRNTPPEDGARLFMGVQLKGEGDKEVQTFTTYDAIDKIAAKFKNGDKVFIQAQTNPQQYDGQDGSKITRMDYEIQKIFVAKEEIDFEAEGFEEMSNFQQKGVYLGSEVVKDEETGEQALNIDLRIITNKDGTYIDFVYPLPLRTDGLKKLAKNIKKRVKPFHLIELTGNVRNEAVVEEVEAEEEDDWGGEEVAGFGGAITRYNRVNEVLKFGTEFWKDEENQKKYKEADFQLDEFNDEDDDFGGDGDGIDFGDDDDDF